jgi:hypothetical protein
MGSDQVRASALSFLMLMSASSLAIGANCGCSDVPILEANIRAAARYSHILNIFSEFAKKCLITGCPQHVRSPKLVLGRYFSEFYSGQGKAAVLTRFPVSSPEMQPNAIIDYIIGSKPYPTVNSAPLTNVVAGTESAVGASYEPLGAALRQDFVVDAAAPNARPLPAIAIPADYLKRDQTGKSVPDQAARDRKQREWKASHGGKDLCDVKDQTVWEREMRQRLAGHGLCKEIVESVVVHEMYHLRTCRRMGFFGYTNQNPDESAAEEAKAFDFANKDLIAKHLRILAAAKWRFDGHGTTKDRVQTTQEVSDVEFVAKPASQTSTGIVWLQEGSVERLDVKFIYDLPVTYKKVTDHAGVACTIDGPNPIKNADTTLAFAWNGDEFGVYAGGISIVDQDSYTMRRCGNLGVSYSTPLPFFWAPGWAEFKPGRLEFKSIGLVDSKPTFTPVPGSHELHIHYLNDEAIGSHHETTLKLSHACGF